MFFQIQDILMVPIWSVILITVSIYISKRWYLNTTDGRDFLWLVSLKMASGILLGVLYMWYYGYGDTLRYFFSGSVMADVMVRDPEAGIRLLLGGNSDLSPDMKEVSMLIPYWKHQASALTIAKISAVLSLLTLDSYFANSLIFSFISATGIWVLYRMLLYYLPEQKKTLRIGVLFMPSMIFWSSGVFKDPIAIGVMGWLLWSFHQWIQKRKPPILILPLLFATAYILFVVKVYILLALLPFLAIAWAGNRAIQIENIRIRRRFKIIAGAIGIGLTIISIQFITAFYPQFAMELLIDSIVANRNELLYTDAYYTQGYGSRFDIGSFDASLSGIIQMLPSAFVSALFRPAIWDARSLIMLPAILENMVLFVWVLTWIVGSRIRNLFSGFKDKPIVSALFLFSLVFLCFVGLSTSNFGTMSRYRLPAMPFFIAGIACLKKNKKSVPISSTSIAL